MKYKIVYSKKLFDLLAERKIYPAKMERNIRNPRYYVWFYEPTKEFMDVLIKYTNKEVGTIDV